jgi:hypothetical protein
MVKGCATHRTMDFQVTRIMPGKLTFIAEHAG